MVIKKRSAIKTDLFADTHHRKKIDKLGDLLAEIEADIDFVALAAEGDRVAPRLEPALRGHHGPGQYLPGRVRGPGLPVRGARSLAESTRLTERAKVFVLGLDSRGFAADQDLTAFRRSIRVMGWRGDS